MSNLSAIEMVANPSELTTGLFNQRYSVISANFAALNSDLTLNLPSGDTFSLFTNLDVSGNIHASGQMGIGPTPSAVTTGVMTIAASSAVSDYIHFEDTSGSRSDYLIGSRVGGTADGLNIYDLSGQTMIASFSKQSIRFFQQVVGPVFDVGGALADTYNAATFGTGADSTESRIQAAINQASTDVVSRVYVPATMYPYSASSVSFVYAVQMVREGGNWGDYDVRAYGAAGDGTQDDTSAFSAAIGSVLGNGLVSTVRFAAGPIYVPSGTYKITAPLRFRSANGIKFSGAGISSNLQAASRMSVMLDIDGVGHSVFEDFATSAVAGSTASYMFLLHTSPGAPRGNSGINFRQIYIGRDANSTSSAFAVGFGVGTVSTDSNIGMDGCSFERVFVQGDWTSTNTGMYEWGFKIGPDSIVNIQDMYFYNSEVLACRTGIGFTGGGGGIYGTQFESNRTDIETTFVPSQIKISGIRSEGALQFLTTLNSTGAAVGIDVDTCEFAADGITTSGNKTIIQHGYSGMMTIRNFKIYAAGSSAATFRVVANNGSGGLGTTVVVDGFVAPNNQTVEQTFTTISTAPVCYVISGFATMDASESVVSIVPFRIYNPSVVPGNVTPGMITTAISTALVTKTSSYTATEGDCVVLADATASLMTVGLPSAVSHVGLLYRVKKVDSTANRVMVASVSGNIDGTATKALAVQYQSLDLASDGVNWFIL